MKQILVFILFSGLLCWMMFAPVYKHVVIARHAVLQQEVDYMLEIGASGTYGYIGKEMMENSRARMAEVGMKPEEIHYEVSATSGKLAIYAASPVPRGDGIRLSISYPFENLFVIDSLLGIPTPASTDRMQATGIKMSEYVPENVFVP